MYQVRHFEPLDSTYHYVKITDDTSGTSADIWTPASGKQPHITGGIVSVTASGVVQIRDKTADKDIAVLEFEAVKSIPFSLGTDLVLEKDHVIEAKWTISAASGDVHTTLYGHEH